MQKLKKWFHSLDKTKRVAFLFVGVSFLLILLISFYNMMHPSTIKKDKEDIVIEKETSKKEEKQKTDTQEETSSAQIEVPIENKQEESEQTQQNVSPTTQVAASDEMGNENVVEYVNISISIVGMNDELIASGNVQMEKGKSAYDALVQFAKEKNIVITTTGFGPYVYVSGINGFNEREHGASSGWMYKVNEVAPNQSAGECILKDHDQMLWYYIYD
ncbi:MAG: DUF4430 domain-containing protein [Erysipelotrichia bacterium]|nr:DUF4430 domain-containing protein [Erysipelotrichia bacterium]NCC54456.1 DUF4430 domain-containing protein [Erysipelotrichia bacterium]